MQVEGRGFEPLPLHYRGRKQMKVSAEMPYANEYMVGKPVKVKGRVVGKVVGC